MQRDHRESWRRGRRRNGDATSVFGVPRAVTVRALARARDHVACQKPVPLAPEAGHVQEGGAVSRVARGVNRLLSTVEGIVTAVNPSGDIQESNK